MNEANLTQGSAYTQLIRLSLPIMGTSLIQMSYNIMDMFWLGKISSEAVSAAGISGYIVWIGFSISLLCKTGAEIGTGQSIGNGNNESLQKFINNSLSLGIILSLIFSVSVLFFRNNILGFFLVKSPTIQKMTIDYLSIITFAVPINFMNTILTGIYHGFGNSRITFMTNAVGLIVNMILDPLLMFGFGLGVAGAAWATAIAQGSVFTLFIIFARRKREFRQITLFRWDKKILQTILKWGIPVSSHLLIFACIASIIARMVFTYGNYAFAAQQIGVQIESIGWLTYGGLSTSIGVFVAQNYGAQNKERVIDGIKKGRLIATAFGVAVAVILYFGADYLVPLFVSEKETITYGIAYLHIMVACQVFSAWEASATGALNGLGKTIYPSTIGVVGNLLRIPCAYFLSSYYGVFGIWWAMCLSSIFKGLVPQAFLLYIQSRIHKLFQPKG